MENSQAPEAPDIRCPICYDSFSRNFTMKRHMVRIHGYTYEEYIHNNTNDIHNNTNDLYNNTNDIYNNTNNIYKNTNNIDTEEIETKNDKEYRCKKCDKCLYAKWYLTKHMEKCKGIRDKHSCEYCHKIFKHDNSRFGHYKICKVKKERDATALIPYEPLTNEPMNVNTINNNIQTQNNNNIQTQNNIDTQNNTQNIIVVYHQDNIEYLKDHIGEEALEYIKKMYPRVDRRIVMDYSKRLFDRPENQCVQKKNLKMGHSDVHIGNNEWEAAVDKSIYPKLACGVANHMSDYLHTKRDQLRKEAFDKIISFVDYMADEGYINTEDKEKEKRILREYQMFVKELKMIIYNKTKEVKQRVAT